MGLFSRKPNVEKMIKEGDIKGLMESLNHKNEKVRLNAAFGLALAGDASALEPFVQTLLNADLSIPEIKRRELARLDLHKPEIVDPFINTLKNRDFNIRWGGALTLANRDEPAVIESLIKLLDDQDWSVRGLAIAILGKIGAPAVELLTLALHDENRDVRWGAAIALGYIGDEGALESLREACEDSDNGVRKAAEEALVAINTGVPSGTDA